MVEGQRFFLRAPHTSPLKERIARVGLPDPADPSDEAFDINCRRFVKTNYHPSGTCNMGARNDPNAVLDPRMRVRGVERLRVCDLSAMPNINAGKTNAPALILGTQVRGIHHWRLAGARTCRSSSFSLGGSPKASRTLTLPLPRRVPAPR